MRIIGGKFRNRKLFSPKGNRVRPSSDYLRELLFNLLRNHIEGASFLDLFAGSGTVGLEALSRGAKAVVFVEADRETARCLQRNVELLDSERQCQILVGEVGATLQNCAKQARQFDLIFADPPYFVKGAPFAWSDRVLQWVDEHSLLLPGGRLYLEDSLDRPKETFSLSQLVLLDERRAGKTLLRTYEAPLEATS